MSAISIKINPPLTDIRLADVLDAIVKVADRPIKYSIEDYAVIFSLKARETTPLYVRTFKVDPNTFYQGLQGVGSFVFGASYNVGNSSSSGGGGLGGGGGGGGMGGGGGGMGGGGMGGGGMSGGMGGMSMPGSMVARVNVAGGGMGGGMMGGMGGGMMGGMGGGMGGGGLNFITRTNDMVQVSEQPRAYFDGLGVDLDPVRNPGKALFFNDRQGMLVVRATLQDLDMIEVAIQVLNTVPPQVDIKAKFVEISQDDVKALGFDWYLGNVLMAGGAIGGQGGTAPSFNGAPTAANPLGTFPGVPANPVTGAAGTTIAPASTDTLLTSGLRNPSSSLFTLTGILTDPQFRLVIHALQQRSGAELLAQPEVTAQSGRQAQMKATDVVTVVTGFGFSQNTGTTGGAVGGTGTVVAPATSTFVYPEPEQMEIGPTLDVIPCVLSDGFTINLTLIPTYQEFVGYDNPNDSAHLGVDDLGRISGRLGAGSHSPSRASGCDRWFRRSMCGTARPWSWAGCFPRRSPRSRTRSPCSATCRWWARSSAPSPRTLPRPTCLSSSRPRLLTLRATGCIRKTKCRLRRRASRCNPRQPPSRKSTNASGLLTGLTLSHCVSRHRCP